MLHNGDVMPSITGRDLDGDAIDIAGIGAGTWRAILLYRGHW